MSALPWLAIFLAAPAAWLLRWRGPALALLAGGYGAALWDGQLDYRALLPMGLLGVAAYAVAAPRRPGLRYAGHALFLVLALALSLHWLPGFHNPRVIGPERLSAEALPYSLYLNLDKALIGFWLLLAGSWVQPRARRYWLPVGLGVALLTAALCLALATGQGWVAWAPKWPPQAGLWLLNNLLLVAATEEALFRAYLQGGLSRSLQQRPYGALLAWCVPALLFGLAHAAGGWPWIVLASIAGLGYGLAWRYGGWAAAVLAHFGLNAAHFLLFSYPMLQTA